MSLKSGLVLSLIVLTLGVAAWGDDQTLPAPGTAGETESAPPKGDLSGTGDSATPAENRPIFLIDEPSSLLRTPPPLPEPPKLTPSTSSADAVAQLARSNRELLDLLQRQQATLEDLQYDRRLQSRQILNLEQQLILATREDADLNGKVAKLQANLDNALLEKSKTPAPPPNQPAASPNNPSPNPAVLNPALPLTPASFIPPEQTSGPAGTMWWHRLAKLQGDAVNKRTDWFLIKGRTWRVIWHNLDRSGASYKNTSALFITAVPRNVSIPQKVCSALGSGGDVAELEGPGTYYLQIDGSGGSWELAIEDLRP